MPSCIIGAQIVPEPYGEAVHTVEQSRHHPLMPCLPLAAWQLPAPPEMQPAAYPAAEKWEAEV